MTDCRGELPWFYQLAVPRVRVIDKKSKSVLFSWVGGWGEHEMKDTTKKSGIVSLSYVSFIPLFW